MPRFGGELNNFTETFLARLASESWEYSADLQRCLLGHTTHSCCEGCGITTVLERRHSPTDTSLYLDIVLRYLLEKASISSFRASA